MSNQKSDSLLVAVELEGFGSAPSHDELALVESHFGELLKLAVAELAADQKEE